MTALTRRPATTTSTALTALLFGAAAGVLLQAVLAGLFISGVADARMVHLMVGSLLPWYGLVPAGAAALARRSGRCTSGVLAATLVLPVLLWVQEVLGHMPFAVSTAIHVPLGVSLLTYAVVLALASTRNGAGYSEKRHSR